MNWTSIKNLFSRNKTITTLADLRKKYPKKDITFCIESLLNNTFEKKATLYFQSHPIVLLTINDFFKIYPVKDFNNDLNKFLKIDDTIEFSKNEIMNIIFDYKNEINRILDYLYMDLQRKEQITFSSIDELINLDDKTGDVQIAKDFKVNSFVRDYAIAYLDDKLYVGATGEHHHDLVRKFLNERNINLINFRGNVIDDPTQFDLKNTIQDMNDAVDANTQDNIDLSQTAYMFGHVWKNIGFIDDISSNLNFGDIANLIKSELGLLKVYRHSYRSNNYPRLAKRVTATKIKTLNKLYHYIPPKTLLTRLDNEVDDQLVQSLISWGYDKSLFPKIDNVTLDRLLPAYVAVHLKPFIEQEFGLNDLAFSYTDVKNDFVLYDYLNRHLKIAVIKLKEMVNNKYRFETLLKDDDFKSQYNILKQQIIRRFCSKSFVEQYLENYQIKSNYSNLMDLNPSDLFQYYSSLIKNYLIKGLKVDFSLIDKPTLIKELLDDIKYSAELSNAFFRTINKFILPLTHQRVKDLKANEDKIGDDVKVNIEYLDINNRSKAFIIIDGVFYAGYSGESHANIVKRVSESANKEQSVFGRSDIHQLINPQSLAFGHMVGNLAFIEADSLVGNITMAEAIQIVKDTHKFVKIYTAPERNYVTRLAKRRI